MRPLLFLCLAHIEATAQPLPILPIGEAIRSKHDHAPVHLGETLVVSGVVTDEPHDVGSVSSLANLQDATGGIALFGTHAVLPPGGFKRGDVLEVRGQAFAVPWNGGTADRGGPFNGTAEVPAPLEVSAIQLRGEEQSGKLVRAHGQIVLLPNGGIALRDRSGEIQVYLLRSYFQHTIFMKRLLQGGQVEIIGLARQRVNDGEPLNSGYLLSPRDELDFKFGPLTRYQETAAGALLVLGCFLYLWWRRRAAEKESRR